MNKARIKIIAFTLFIIFVALCFLTSDNTIRKTEAFSSNLQGGYTGAPGELTCAITGCHSGALNPATGQFVIEAPDAYEPGNQYRITVSHQDDDQNRMRWGFQLTALTSDNKRAGTLEPITEEGEKPLTKLLTQENPSRQYIEHTSKGTFQGQSDTASWTFLWKAPDDDIGRVIFYAAGNQADGNGKSTGDRIFTTFRSVYSPDDPLPPRPNIDSALIDGKKLIVEGSNFVNGAVILLDDSKQKTKNDSDSPKTKLIGKKTGKKIKAGTSVVLKVRNPDGQESDDYAFMRPDN